VSNLLQCYVCWLTSVKSMSTWSMEICAIDYEEDELPNSSPIFGHNRNFQRFVRPHEHLRKT
jgi:hypothetical protein